MSKITSVIPTFNNLPYLKLTVQSVRQNCYYKDMPIFIFAENCTDGTNEWLAENADRLDIEYYIERVMKNNVALVVVLIYVLVMLRPSLLIFYILIFGLLQIKI